VAHPPLQRLWPIEGVHTRFLSLSDESAARGRIFCANSGSLSFDFLFLFYFWSSFLHRRADIEARISFQFTDIFVLGDFQSEGKMKCLSRYPQSPPPPPLLLLPLLSLEL